MKIIIASYKCCKRISHLSFQVNRTVDQDFLINFPPTYPIIKHRFKYKLFIKLNQHLWIWISKASLNLPSLKYHKWMLSLFWHKECSTFVFLVMICQVIIFRLRFWILSQLDQIFFFFPPTNLRNQGCDIHFLHSLWQSIVTLRHSFPAQQLSSLQKARLQIPGCVFVFLFSNWNYTKTTDSDWLWFTEILLC